MKKAYIIMDGQWGSCGKGLIAGKLALDRKPDGVVCNFGPNAGHTFISEEVGPIMTQQLPSGIVHVGAKIFIGPGAIINPEVLLNEIGKFADYNISERLHIHPRAAIVTQGDITEENITMGIIGSTKKGVGSALARKIRRHSYSGFPIIAKDCHSLKNYVIDEITYNTLLHACDLIQIESAQGFELSLNHGTSYPQCTSRDVTPEAILNDVGIPRRFLKEVIVALRTYPIRVGHELDGDGEIIGHSGPVYPDQKELTWERLSEKLGIPLEEKTTVTGKVRRVFEWSWAQFNRSMHMIGPCSLFVNFVNYLTPEEKAAFLHDIVREGERFGAHLEWIGEGPSYEDVKGAG